MRVCACGCGQEFEPCRSVHRYYSKKCYGRVYRQKHRAKLRAYNKHYYQGHRAKGSQTERICACGCGKKFKSTRPWHRYYSKKCNDRDYYQRHRAIYSISNKQQSRQHREYVWSVSIQKSCQVCGNDDKRVLCFHHRNPKDKKFAVLHTRAMTHSPEEIKAEIAKCDVLCANDHKIIHWNIEND